MVEKGGFDFGKMLQGLDKHVEKVQGYLDQLEGKGGAEGDESVSLTLMFQLQLHMQIMSQYIEATSNVMSAVHNEMITMARATKGQ